MKQLYTALLIYFCSTLFAQTDTITLTNGRTIVGTNADFYNGQLILTDTLGDNYLIKYNLIKSMNVALPIGSSFGNSSYKWCSSVAEMQMKYRNTFLADKESYLKKAGNIGIAATVMFAGGGLLSVAGLITQNANLAYAGAGIASAGIILYIPTFVFIRKAGTLPHYEMP